MALPFCTPMLRSERGVTLIYVVAALLLATLVALGLSRLSVFERSASGDVGALHDARIAAESGLDWAEAQFSDSASASLGKINQFIVRNRLSQQLRNPVDLVGSADLPSVIFGAQKCSVRICAWDSASRSVQVESVGYGRGGSRKTLTGIFVIANVVPPVVSGAGGKYALFVGNGCTDAPGNAPVAIHAGQTINGDVYIGSSANFSGWSTGTRIKGRFSTAKIPAGRVNIEGNYTFDSAAYFGMPVWYSLSTVNNIDSTCTFKSNVGFDYAVSAVSKYRVEVAGSRMWANGSFNSVFGWNFRVVGIGAPSFRCALAASANVDFTPAPIMSAPVNNLRTLLGFPSPPGEEPGDVRVDSMLLKSIVPAKILTLNNTTIVPGSGIDRDWMHAQYVAARAGGRLWNFAGRDFLVIKLPPGETYYLADKSPKVDFDGDVIWWIPPTTVLAMAGGSQGLYNTAKNSVSLFYVQNGGKLGRLGGWTSDFYGSINCDRGGEVIIGGGGILPDPVAAWSGGIHIQNGGRFTLDIDNSGPPSFSLNYNPSVESAFGSLVGFPSGTSQTAAVTDTLVLSPGATSLSPVLISKRY